MERVLGQGWSSKKSQVWKEIEKKYNGLHLLRNGFSAERVQFDKDGLFIVLDTRTEVRHGGGFKGRDSVEYTRIIAPYENQSGFYCEIYNEGFFQSIGKKLGMQDIEVGIEEFDRNFILKSNRAETMKKILADPALVEEIERHPNMKFMVKTKNRLFGEYHPAGIDQISFEEEGEITDIKRLESIFNIFSMFYERMLDFGAAK